MKRILFGTFVAIAAMFSACQSLEQPNATVKVIEGEQITFTASLGVDTKAYLDYDEASKVYKTKWSADDRIIVMARQDDGSYVNEFAVIAEGAGTTNAKFSGTLESDDYIAYYGYCWLDNETGTVMPQLLQYQGWQEQYDEAAGSWVRKNFIDRYFPMYAESNDKNFEFQNLCSVLKVSLTGADYIDNIVFTPNDPTMAVAGRSFIEFDEAGEPEIVMANDSTAMYSVIYQLGMTLDPVTPTDCYIVLPPATYKGGFTITVNSVSGCLTRTINEDVVFERSQIRSLSPITYKDENLSDWAIIGSMSNWSEDIPMTYEGDGIYQLNDFYLTPTDEFKFRANGDWATNFGLYDYEVVSPNTTVYLYTGGANIRLATEGYYNITLDVINQYAVFELVKGVVEPVICYSFDEVAALPDGTYVAAPGHVFGVYQRGFIFNIGGNYDNCILVYQGTNQSMYQPVLGNQVNVFAYKTTYRGLPELYNVQAIEVADDNEYDYGYNSYWNLLNPQYFDNFYTERYDYVKYSGTLEYENGYWNVYVDGATTKVGSIDYPVQDLTEYIGQKVVVEGWFIGFSGNGRYVSTVLKEIYVPENGGSTEDVIPGDDIFIPGPTKAKLNLR